MTALAARLTQTPALGEREVSGGGDILERLMELWQEPWSERAFGEAQMLSARLRAVVGREERGGTMHHHKACPVRSCDYTPDTWDDARTLDQAWRAVVSVLPKGASVGVHKTVGVYSGEYVATTDHGPAASGYAYAATPADALWALAEKLELQS